MPAKILIASASDADVDVVTVGAAATA